MKYNNFAAIVAAEISLSLKLRSRLVQLPPRAFHLLSRGRNVSSITRRPLTGTAPRRTASSKPDHNVAKVLPEGATADEGQNEDGSGEVPIPGETREAKVIRIRRDLFVNSMRTVPHPVVVITARRQDVDDDLQGTVAATVSSFNTVSMTPDPVVSFNLKADSTTYKTIVDSKYFTVTFPQMTLAGSNLANSFTRGNHPSPFYTDYSDHPTPRLIQWIEKDQASSSDLKHRPGGVALADVMDDNASGFAFACLFEYQTSTHVGDHVVVTGRLTRDQIKTTGLGWAAMSRRQHFASSNITLAYVHGTYSNADTGLGFANLHKLDDTRAGGVRTDVGPAERIERCKRMLVAIRSVPLVQRGVKVTQYLQHNHGKLPATIRKAVSKSPELLQKYEWYYIQRMEFWKRRLAEETASQQASGSETVADQEAPSNLPYSQLEGYKQLFVRNKELLSEEELDEEIELYNTRLLSLQLRSPEGNAASQIEETAEHPEELTSEEIQGFAATVPDEDEISRDELLVKHFQERVHLLELAKARKSGEEEPTTGTQPQRQDAQKPLNFSGMGRFVGVHKLQPLETLKTKYRRMQYQITEARLSLVGQEVIPGDNADVKILRDRIAYYTPRLQVLADIMRQRAQSSSVDLVLATFKPPPMQAAESREEAKARTRRPHSNMKRLDLGGDDEVMATREEEAPASSDRPDPVKSVRRVISTPESFPDHLESFDQLDSTEEALRRQEDSRAAVRRAANVLPIGRPPRNMHSRSEVDVQQELRAEGRAVSNSIRDPETDILRQNANGVRDYLVLQSEEDGAMPSPDDFVDVNKMRKERLQREEEERERKQSPS